MDEEGVREVRTVKLKELHRRMEDKEISVEIMATMLGMCAATFYRVLEGKSDPRLSAVFQICDMLEIDYSDIPKYFISKK